MMHISPPSPHGEVPWDRLGRLMAGELTADEEAHLLSWLAADPARERLVAELRDLWAVTEPGSPSRDPEQVLAAIRRRDASPVRDLAAHRRFMVAPSISVQRPLRRALAAAALAGLALGGWWAVRAVRPFGGSQALISSASTEHRTARGQRLVLTLPDGSTVMLGPESVLRYTPAYGDTARLVELVGEGYFDVIHDDTHPFLVRAGNAIARDVGTRFVVSTRGDGATVDVAVKEGRVALGGTSRPISEAVLLDARDVGRVDGTGRAVARRGVSLDVYVGWTEGRLVFEATPLAAVVAELSRWYDADVQLAGAGLAERQLTAEFHNEPLSKVLPMVQASLGLKLRVSGRQYILSAQ